MKRPFLLLFAIAVFASALATSASGQTSKTMRTNVTFDFQIGDRIYPAGEYRIQSISSLSDNILLIRNVSDSSKTQIIVAHHSNVRKGQEPKLVFLREGDSYFLAEIFLDSGRWSYSIPQSRRLRESERNLASRVPRNNRKP